MASMNINGVDQEVVSLVSQSAGLALDGSDATGVTPPSGASGIRGWLSGIFAKLPSFGSAGTPATSVVTVQGIASGTAQPVTFPAGSSVGITTALSRNTSSIPTSTAASATYQTAPLDTGVAAGSASPYATYKATLNPNQSGTAQFLYSNNGTTFSNAGAPIAVAGGSWTTLQSPIYGRYVALLWTNGSAATAAAAPILEQLSAV